MTTLKLQQDTQCLLEQVYSFPELFGFSLKEDRVFLTGESTEPMLIGTLNTDIPSVALPLLKIKSWRLHRSPKDALHLSLNLII